MNSGQRARLTPAQHVFSLQELNDGRLCGRNQYDAAVLSSAHQPPLRRDIHAGRHLNGVAGAGQDAQLVNDARWRRHELIKGLLETNAGRHLELWEGDRGKGIVCDTQTCFCAGLTTLYWYYMQDYEWTQEGSM